MFQSEEFQQNLKKALSLVCAVRQEVIRLNLDPYAVRLALKFAMLSDTYAAEHSETPITAEEEIALDEMANDLLQDAIQHQP